MKVRTRRVLLGGGIALVVAIAGPFTLGMAFLRSFDPHDQCMNGYSTWVDCTVHVSTRTVTQGEPAAGITPANPLGTLLYRDVTSWAVVRCPENTLVLHLLCANPSAASPVRAASDDFTTGLPRPMPWLLVTAKNSPLIESLYIETPLDLSRTLDFYRSELTSRGWTENDGATIAPDRAVIAFATADGPALLRLTRANNRTIVDLSRRKPVPPIETVSQREPSSVTAYANTLPKPGEARLLLGNATDDAADITVDGQNIALPAHGGAALRDDPYAKETAPENPGIDLPPGKVQVVVKGGNRAPATAELEITAGESWGLLAGQHGVLPVRLY